MLDISTSDSCSFCSMELQMVDGKGDKGKALPRS